MLEIAVALLIAAVTVMLLIYLVPARPEGWSALPIFLLFFLLIWAGGVWFTPVGTPVWGVYWAPFALVALFVALLWAVLLAGTPTPSVEEDERRRLAREPEIGYGWAGLGLLFWVLIFGLAIAIIIRYVNTTIITAARPA